MVDRFLISRSTQTGKGSFGSLYFFGVAFMVYAPLRKHIIVLVTSSAQTRQRCPAIAAKDAVQAPCYRCATNTGIKWSLITSETKLFLNNCENADLPKEPLTSILFCLSLTHAEK